MVLKVTRQAAYLIFAGSAAREVETKNISDSVNYYNG
jgi:hypothetical protein